MKVCANCGNQLEDSAKFCGGCGAVQEDAANNTANQSIINKDAVNNTVSGVLEKASKITKGKIWLIPVAAVAAVAVIWFIVFFFYTLIGSGSVTQKGAIEAYFKAKQKQSGKQYLDATLSSSMLKAVKEQTDMDKEEIIEEFDDYLDTDDLDDAKFKNVVVKFTYDFDKEDVKILKERIKDEFDCKVSISDAAEVEILYKEWDDDAEVWNSKTAIITVYKSAGNWYVLDPIMDRCITYDKMDYEDSLKY